MRVLGRAGSLPVCRKIERLFLARRVWIILIQKVLELGEDVLALVLGDQVLLLLRLLLSQLFVNIDGLRVGVAVCSGELAILTLVSAHFVNYVLVDVVWHILMGAHGGNRGAVLVIAGPVETVGRLLDSAEVLL